MKNKKIVIISAVFYPLNSPRANRTTELAKEFARKGHDVTVYAVLGKYDYSQFEQTYNLKIRDLGEMRFIKFNSDGDVITPSLIYRALLKLIRKLIEFPGIELSYKVVQLLRKKRDVDLLITIASPHTIHWGAAYASKWFYGNKVNTWVADCGDPYMGNKFARRLFYFKYIEKWFCRKVDYISIPIKEAKEGYYKEFHNKIRVIPQGFNFDEVQSLQKNVSNSVITFIYAGNFYSGIRDPRPFLDYLIKLDVDFKFIVYTKSKALIENYKNKLNRKLEIHDYIPRAELLSVMSQADFLINFENNTEVQSPSKLIDYALSKRPILSVNSINMNKTHIKQFLKGNYANQIIIPNIEQYNIRNVVNSFIDLIKD